MQGTILTNIGLSKIASASPETPVVITSIAVGDGAGGYPALNPSANTLTNEVWRGDSSFPIREGALLNTLMFEGLIPRTEGGFTVREIAIFDEDGDMIAIGQTNEIIKPAPNGTQGLVITVRLRITLENTSDAEVIITESINYDHRQLTFRTAADSHTIGAITGLQAALDDKVTVGTSNWSDLIIASTAVDANGQYNVEAIGSDVNITLPAFTINNFLVVHCTANSNSLCRVLNPSFTIRGRIDISAGDNLTLKAGDTVHLVYVATNILEIV